MQVLVLAAQKGGVGRTTLSGHLAVEAERWGAGPVVLIDTDPQGSLSAWWDARQAPTPLFARVDLGQLPEQIAAMAAKGVRLVVIDTQRSITRTVEAVVRAADLVLIPIRPSPHDLRAVGRTVELVERCRKNLAFVINGAAHRARLTTEVAIELSQHGAVFPTVVLQRTDFAASMIDGRTVGEVDPTGAAAREIAKLWTYVNLRLHERQSMEKPASLGIMAEESAGLVKKGDAGAVPNAALLAPVTEVARPRQTQSASPPETPTSRAGDTFRLSPLGYRVFEERKRRAGTGAVQVGVNLDPEMKERLRRMAFELCMPVHAIIEVMLVYFMDDYERGSRD